MTGATDVEGGTAMTGKQAREWLARPRLSGTRAVTSSRQSACRPISKSQLSPAASNEARDITIGPLTPPPWLVAFWNELTPLASLTKA